MPIRKQYALARQRGAATLLVGLILVLVCVLLVIGVAQTTTLEIRMARNTVLANQARQAAQAGFNYGNAWLKAQRPEWITQPEGRAIATPTPNPPSMPSSTDGHFAVNVTFERRAEWNGYLRLAATAVPNGAPEIEARVSQFVRPSSVLTWAGETAPPLVVDGCVDLSAASDVYPAGADDDRVGPAVAASADTACLRLGGVNLHGGALQAAAFTAGELWNRLLSVSRAELEALATEQLARDPNQRDYWWATAADLVGGEWRLSLGSRERPIVLVIPAALGCPRFDGGAQLIGLVLIEADCHGAPGWGDVRIYGSLAVGGDFASLGPTSRLLHISQLPGGPERLEPPVLDLVHLAGSWRDF